MDAGRDAGPVLLQVLLQWAVRIPCRRMHSPKHTRSLSWRILPVLLLPLCAPAPAPAAAHDADPWEGYNRTVFLFNDTVDAMLVKPAAILYRQLPRPVRVGIGNFFSNLGEVRNIVNNLLQGKLEATTDSLSRLSLNSTVGVGGLIDVAVLMGISRAEEDFGQTLGSWGVEPGPYTVLPLLGPSTLRDTLATPADLFLTPSSHVKDEKLQLSLLLTNLVSARASLLAAGEAAASIADDRYALVRDAYLQNRYFRVTDGAFDLLDDYEVPE